jgi:1,2-diacylglycerol 3-beta-glucosyltransferase
MCVATAALAAERYQAFSLVEDLEYGIALARSGVRVHYAAEAIVASEIASSSRAAASQRQRWEKGRASLARRLGFPLLREALDRRSALLLDAAVDLLVPPLSTLVLVLCAGFAVSLLVEAPVWPWLLGIFFVVAHVTRGWAASGLGMSGLRAIAWVPFYVLWKLFALSRTAPREWVRTAREAATQ